MTQKFLHQKLIEKLGTENINKIELPNFIADNLNPKFQIRPYQKKAFQNFICYDDGNFEFKETPIHLLFQMATGSGKTLMMAGLILYLYQKGYRNFLFFVPSKNIIKKTKDNFLNPQSSKYLFSQKIFMDGREININKVNTFDEARESNINICFTTIQQLHIDLNSVRENAITFEDFEENKIVLLGDEAHHLNTATKKSKSDLEKEAYWEETVQTIFKANRKNILLEFTATMDFSHPDIKEKYTDKTIYQYDLLRFRKDKYSKEIKTISLDDEFEKIILHAVLLSQYRLKIAEKNNVFLKPVLLFKAQKTKQQSDENEELFKKIITELNTKKLEKILNSNEKGILKKVFNFFQEKYNNNYQNFVEELQGDFSDEKIINVNDEKNKEKNQLLLNSLEDENNLIRVIFAVQKLNEGWDVLNLFDIVRLYDSRDGKWQRDGKYKAGKTTLSEVQLIGRGARYFPFQVDEEQELFKRKYDEETESELKILEELHYHSKYNSRYLDELEKTLIEQGLKDEKPREKRKIEIVDDEFYEKQFIFKNEKKKNLNTDKKSFKDYGINVLDISYQIGTSKSQEKAIFENDKKENNNISEEIHRIKFEDIHRRIFYKAMNKNSDFWNFRNLKKYFGNLKSIDDFFDEKFFYQFYFTSNDKLENLSCEDQLECVGKLLKEVTKKVKENFYEDRGTKTFTKRKFKNIFKKIKEFHFDISKEEISTEQIKDFFIHDKLYGTGEEKNFIEFFSSYLEKLQQKYSEVKLVRNERELKLYRFKDGIGFEPDFILFLTEKNSQKKNKKDDEKYDKETSYQVFIEPKGNHLLEPDKEKEKFLKEIKEQHSLELLLENEDYKLLGLKFYNKNNEREFKEDFEEELLQ